MQFRTEERSFSAAEVARLTGTSQDQQRDWRRHGFLPRTAPGRRARFSLLELCIIALVKVQTDAGKAVSGAFTVAKFTAPILYTQVELCPLAVRIEGAELKPRDRGGLLRALAEIGEDEEPSRYVFFPVADPEPSPLAPDPEFLEDEDRLAGAYVLGSLQDVEKCIPHAWTYGTIFDLESFAMKLALQVREPLITYFRKADSK